MSSATASSAFVRKLASNDKKTRDGALESLRRYLASKSTSKHNKISLLDYEKLWKGLYFSMWYCDRAPAQERLSESLGKLYSENINDHSNFNLFVKAFFQIMILQWPSIDQWRIDKYYLLIRRVLRHNFKYLKSQNWDNKLIQGWLLVLNEGILSGDKSIPMALPYHLCDIFIEELELVIFEDLQEEELNKDDKDYLEKYQALIKTKIDICSNIPIKDLISPFARLNKEAALKTLREKCKEDVLDDERLITWGVVEDEDDEDEDDEDEDEDNEEEGKRGENDDDEEDEDEWKGF
ncbi:putative ribosome biogenesis protein [Scheffersomyces amazonensis]|uniref:putative ribosome biogenesis protein n=1 Tax=Scheffersomyces amazonensis TaxID=1078765 RepID=UPI00315DAC06